MHFFFTGNLVHSANLLEGLYVIYAFIYGCAINNHHGPNEQHAKSINQSIDQLVSVIIGWIWNVKSLVLA